MACHFARHRCPAHTTYKVAGQIGLHAIQPDQTSVIGEYDFLMKLNPPYGADTGRLIQDNLLIIDGIGRTNTTHTCKAF